MRGAVVISHLNRNKDRGDPVCRQDRAYVPHLGAYNPSALGGPHTHSCKANLGGAGTSTARLSIAFWVLSHQHNEGVCPNSLNRDLFAFAGAEHLTLCCQVMFYQYLPNG